MALQEEPLFAAYDPAAYTVVKHPAIRKTIARRLSESKQSAPHFYVRTECELDHAMAWREAWNKDNALRGASLSVNDMVIRAWALALTTSPKANASWHDTGMVMHQHVDISVAVALPDGLLAPVLRRCQEKSLETISLEMKELAQRARERKLTAQELQGGTTSLSNLGRSGISDFCAILNPPQATILAVGAVKRRPLVRDDALVVGYTMAATLSLDHRVLDGVAGAELLQSFKGFVEDPQSL